MRRVLLGLVLGVVLLFGVVYVIQVWPAAPLLALLGACVTVALSAWAIRLLRSN
jgi:hypothetical protein